jgi:putative membrane protein
MKIITHWIISAVAIAITAYLLRSGVIITGLVPLLVFAIVLGGINAFLRPILIVLTLPLSIFTLGLFVLVINALLVMLASAIVSGFVVVNFWWALLFGIVLGLVHAVLHRMEA